MIPGVNPYAEGSCEVSFGATKVLVTASVLREVPRWMENKGVGWITAEYGMLPRATHTRSTREASTGKQGGRTMEIQRLIGRALRQAVSPTLFPGITVRIDCDVLCADGGTRVASICGGWIALALALEWVKGQGLLTGPLVLEPIAAISVGVLEGVSILDLCYEEDSKAEFDLNLVFNGKGEVIEIQGTAEKRPLSSKQLTDLIGLGAQGIQHLIEIQKQALGPVNQPS